MKNFAFSRSVHQPLVVQEPLAFVLYEKLMPGSRLVNRLQDLKYRVLTIMDASQLVALAESHKPMLIFADLDFGGVDVVSAIKELRENSATTHIPLIAFADDGAKAVMESAQKAGATVVVSDAAVLTHLSQLLERALQVE